MRHTSAIPWYTMHADETGTNFKTHHLTLTFIDPQAIVEMVRNQMKEMQEMKEKV